MENATPAAWRRTAGSVVALAVVAVAWAVLQFWGLGLTQFHTKGEPREAIVVQDLLRSGDWVLPKRNGVGLPRKPPLFYWLAALSVRAGGQLDEASVRRPSAVLSGAVALLLSATAAALYGPVAALVSGLALLTSFEWLRAATAARVDMTLTFGLSLVFIALLNLRRTARGPWLLVFYGGVAWATLAKGIPGLAIPLLAVVALCLADRSLAMVRRLRPLRGLPAVLLIAAAWYAAAAAQGGREFLSIVVSENLLRVLGGRDAGLGHEHSVGYLAGVLLVGLLPWTLLLPSVAGALWRDRAALQRGDARLLALLWAAVVLLPYALAASKRGVYLLPLYPAVALLLGWWADRLVREARTSGWLSGVIAPLLWLLALLLGLLALATAAQWRGLPLLEAATPFVDLRAAADLVRIAAAADPRMAFSLTVATLAAVTAALALRRRAWGPGLAALVACSAAIILPVRLHILPAIAAGLSRRPFVEALRRSVADPSQLATSPRLDYGTIFYWGELIPTYVAAAGGDPPRYLLLPEGEWLRMPEPQRSLYRRVSGLRIARTNNQGYVTVVERIDE